MTFEQVREEVDTFLFAGNNQNSLRIYNAAMLFKVMTPLHMRLFGLYGV